METGGGGGAGGVGGEVAVGGCVVGGGGDAHCLESVLVCVYISRSWGGINKGVGGMRLICLYCR